jgi:hypothetical protein
MTLKHVAALALALACTLGCAQSKLAEADIRMLPYYSLDPPAWPSNHRVAGLAEAVDLAPPGRPVKLLTIHGMVASASGFSTPWQKEITDRLELVADSPPVTVKLFRGYDAQLIFRPAPVGATEPHMTSGLTRTVWRDRKDGSAKLIVYELLWAPIRDDMKYRFMGCFESRSEATDREHAEVKWDCPKTYAARNSSGRALINGGLKDSIIVRGFADAVIINGPLGDILRDDLALATCVMASDTIAIQKTTAAAQSANIQPTTMSAFESKRCNPKDVEDDKAALVSGSKFEYFVLTHSLGSYYFLESQRRHQFADPVEQRDTIQFTMFDNATVFMFANQVSLLSLANLEGYCLPHEDAVAAQRKCPNFRLKLLDELMDEEPTFGGSFTDYVAFNDADDLLGFELPPHLSEVNLGRYINVSVRNPAFEIPYLFRDPGGVHTSQERNPAIIDAIVNGIEVPDPTP